jgi:hypothetical protein
MIFIYLLSINRNQLSQGRFRAPETKGQKTHQTFQTHQSFNPLPRAIFARIMTQTALIDRLESDLRQLLETVRVQIATLPEEALLVRPVTGRWNALECFAHLNFFFDIYLSRIELSIHKAKARKWSPAQKVAYTMMGKSDIKRANPYNDKAFRTHKRYDFLKQDADKSAVKRFLINSERLLRYLQAARDIDLNKPKIGRGPSAFFSYTLGNTFEWLVLHAQRHVAQAQRLLSTIPTAS